MSTFRDHGQNANSSRVRLVAHYNGEAPLEENMQQVLLELADASSSTGDRSGLDLVAVLDVSGSMAGTKLEATKTAMRFVIKKLSLSPNDRLSIVSFSTEAKILCPLSFMTEASHSQAKLEGIVNGLKHDNWTNMRAGLRTGLDLLAGRSLSGDRVASIFLMSDGVELLDGHRLTGDDSATAVDIGNVAVYTFGFGDGQDATVLDTIARKSQGGTYNDVMKVEDLTIPFSMILGGLLSVVVQDLKLTVRQHSGHSKIEKVDAGSYPQTKDANAGAVTISFSALYAREVRKVIVDLLLFAVEERTEAEDTTGHGPGRGGDHKPCCSSLFRTVCYCCPRARPGAGSAPAAVRREHVAPVITAQCSYRIRGKSFSSPTLRCSIRRTRSADLNYKPPEVRTELARRLHAQVLGDAIFLADREELKKARDKLEEDQIALDAEQSNDPMIVICKIELKKSVELTETRDIYKTQGSAFLRACKTSHDRQRVAIRDDVQVVFVTPSTESSVQQAIKFKENPNIQPPSVNEDNPRRRGQPAKARSRIWWEELHEREDRRSWWAWVILILCTVLAIGVIVAGVAVFAVYLLYRPKMPYLVVSDAQLGQLLYGQGGTIQYLQVSITILAKNNNSKADASFSRFDLALGFHGAEVAVLRAEPFVVARESSLPLPYKVVSAGRPLDADGMRSMDESLEAGVVQLDLSGKARTRWKLGIFVKLQFWTRISCHLRFFFPGNGTVMPTDLDRCRSRSP